MAKRLKKSAAVRRRRGALAPEGYFYDSFNYPALVEVLLQPLGPGGVDFSTTLARAERRDAELFGSVEGVRCRYRERYIPGQQLYLREAQPERFASVIVDTNDPDRPILCTT